MGFSKLFLCSLIFIVCILNLSIHSVAYVSINNITLLGDAYFQENGRICLTPYAPSPSPSPSSSIGVGRALYNHPIRFLDHKSLSAASFRTSFTFFITPSPSSSFTSPIFGDSLSLSLTSNVLEDGNGVSKYNKKKGKFFSIEFDIDSNYIRIDINSIVSFALVDLNSVGLDLRNGREATIWFEYLSSRKMVKLWLSNTKSRTIWPILESRVDISEHLEEFMFVGFTALNAKVGSARHIVYQWGLRTYWSDASLKSERICYMCAVEDRWVEEEELVTESKELLMIIAIVLLFLWGFVCVVRRNKRGAVNEVKRSRKRHSKPSNRVVTKPSNNKHLKFDPPTKVEEADKRAELEKHEHLTECEKNRKTKLHTWMSAFSVHEKAKQATLEAVKAHLVSEKQATLDSLTTELFAYESDSRRDRRQLFSEINAMKGEFSDLEKDLKRLKGKLEKKKSPYLK
ncbi:hypothetical protein MKX03_029085 [Papaver bracteatum]|nr:hypothetical protein MKX03_029085 [Papaver bracteatum]